MMTVVTMAYYDASATAEKTASTTAEGQPVPVVSDVTITDLAVPKSVIDGSVNKLSVTVANDKLAAAAASGSRLGRQRVHRQLHESESGRKTDVPLQLDGEAGKSGRSRDRGMGGQRHRQ